MIKNIRRAKSCNRSENDSMLSYFWFVNSVPIIDISFVPLLLYYWSLQ
jgi:hypothetical protein